MKLQNNELIKIITTAGYPHYSLKKRIEHDNPDEIIIATNMDDQGRKFIQIIKTMIGKVACSAPIYDAIDLAELLQKSKKNLVCNVILLSRNVFSIILHFRLFARIRIHN